MAVTTREQQMLDLDEQGLRPAAIAQRLGVSKDTVERIIHQLAVRHNGPDNRFHDAARMGSQNLIAAIRRHHPERCGGIHPARGGVE